MLVDRSRDPDDATPLVDVAAILGPPMTDPVARAAFVADPASHLIEAGIALPAWLTVTVVESDAPSLTLSLPPILEEGVIAEILLDSINGGGSMLPPWL